jgi:beta-glucosidase
VLLQNTGNVLPLSPTAKVWVEGSGASDLGHQTGGWTISWQGSGGMTMGTTIKQAISKVTPLAASMMAADIDIVVLSEGPYAEFVGDRQSINTLPPADFALLSAAKAAGKKVVAIVVSGRPVLITSQLTNADAWIAAWLPGTEGDGVADIVFGTVKPTGKLSHSWPAADAMPNVPDGPVNIMCKCGGQGYKPLFPLGFGLTYP